MNKTEELINSFQEIKFKKPTDIIIEQIRSLISSNILKPGDRLPSERTLSERFGVGRGYVREAIKKLEFYGILKTMPQSSTIVASMGVKALEGLITSILDLQKDDIIALLETREILEINATRLAAERASDSDIEELIEAHRDFEKIVKMQKPGIDEDHFFHLKIAECSKNSLLRSLISLITPDIIASSREADTCADGRFHFALKEHAAILKGIQKRDPEAAAKAMEAHMKMAWQGFHVRKP